ncbi:MAG: Rrf2 family transcriptional regulator [Planctomycetes bacterium]|nr:Rrf2 family transcriptional regulator [Planctomycetota bacterium]
MKMSTTAHYGLIAAAYIAEQADEGRVKASTISAKYGIPLEYLIKILQQMVKANILRSKRGPTGGFILACPAKEITLLEIIEAAGGPIASQLELARVAKKAHFSVEMEKVCVRASEKAASILSKAKLSQMTG